MYTESTSCVVLRPELIDSSGFADPLYGGVPNKLPTPLLSGFLQPFGLAHLNIRVLSSFGYDIYISLKGNWPGPN